MGKRVFSTFFLFIFILTSTILPAQQIDYLQESDIKGVMKEIFDRHVEKKAVSGETLKEAFSNYLNQFDPKKIYLLQNEVEPFLNPSKTALDRMVREYNRGDYSSFIKLNQVAQRAIERERKLRGLIESDLIALYRHAPSDETDYKTFAKTKGDLKWRIENDILQFIQVQKDRYGIKAVEERRQHVVNLYNRDRREFENSYLYVNDEGERLGRKEREHQFTLHVLMALARSLDSHTRFFNPSEADNMRTRLLKGYVGTGVVFEEGIDHIHVAKVMEDSPASRDGRVREGDQLVRVDGKEIAQKSYQRVMRDLKGDEGDPIRLTFYRPDTRTTYNVHLVREHILLDDDRVESSYSKVDDGIIGRITLHSFYNNGKGVSSEKDIKKAINNLRKTAPLKGLVLDLRSNTGGYLSEAVKVAGLFITNGVIVISKYNDGEQNYYRDLDGKTFYDGPLVVLISRMTASAAEIVAQALQDYGVAVIAGDDRSYGKGSIQSQNVTTKNNGSYYKVTVGTYYTVSGKTPQEKGVLADVVVPSELVFEDIGERNHDNEEELKNNTIPPAYQDTLSDISPEAKSWFMRYYLPTLQARKSSWQKMIPELKDRSELRLEGQMNTLTEKGLTPKQQLTEAIKIVEDMIELRSQLNNHQVGAYD